MKLTKVQVKNFRSVEDSGVFEVGNLTCLVGKNEAGKTAILKALHGVSPTNDFKYDRTRDYPRRFLSKFDERHKDGQSPVARTWWALENDDVNALEELFGEGVLTSREVEVTSYIGRNGNTWSVPLNEEKCLANLQARHGLNSKDVAALASSKSIDQALDALKGESERSAAQEALMLALGKFREGRALLAAIDVLNNRKPQFFYTSHFDRMSGEVSLNQLATDKQNKK